MTSLTTIPTTTTAASQETKTSTIVDEATSTAIEATIIAAGPPDITDLAENGGFGDSTINPWEVEGASPEVITNPFSCAKGSKCLQLPEDFDNPAKVCQRVAIRGDFRAHF
ncbi:hypothetical protein FHETE_63 [Fusarium heterosporum]|uniref:Uncharacterized protein n=1 Tax=Fusarium heterosporum TaxID=42747 RepID=A0A8H5X526_FUSHE|nr:hypothetical protein FHETE_63 [Fusarium heterosporum]